MFLETLVTGVLDVNTYILGCCQTKRAVVIDPGGGEDEILRVISNNGFRLKYIINTHGHLDHIVGNSLLKEKTGAPILIHKEDAVMLVIPQDPLISLMLKEYTSIPADIKVEENDIIHVGKLSLRIIHTPGHTPGGMSLITDNIVFTGDTLFAGGIGRTDLVGGSYATLIKSIKDKLLVLPDDMKIMPGHGGISTIGNEKKTNPFL